MPKKDDFNATIEHDGKTAPFPSPEAEQMLQDTMRKMLGITGGVLTVSNLLEIAQKLRTLTINNVHRIPNFRQIANKFGEIETLILDGAMKAEEKNQEKLPLDEPETVDSELGYGGQGRRRKRNAA